MHVKSIPCQTKNIILEASINNNKIIGIKVYMHEFNPSLRNYQCMQNSLGLHATIWSAISDIKKGQ